MVIVVVVALVVLVNELDAAASGDISPRRVEDRSAYRNRKQKQTNKNTRKKTTVGELSDARNDPVRGLARGRRPFDEEEADLLFGVSVLRHSWREMTPIWRRRRTASGATSFLWWGRFLCVEELLCLFVCAGLGAVYP